MSGARVTVEELKSHALGRLSEILGALAPGGVHRGGTYTARNPTRSDKRPGSFVVYTRGGAAGAFIEFANRDQEKGDVIDLVSYVLAGGTGFKDKEARIRAYRWIEEFCGLARMEGRSRAAAQDAARRRRHQEEDEVKQAAARQLRAAEKFMRASPSIAGTPVQKYLLEARGIDVTDIPNIERDLRFEPTAEYWLGAEKDERGRRVRSGPRFPAMVAAIRDATGLILGVHITFLTEDGKKAPVDKPKLIAGFVAGGVIRLSKGESGMTPEEAIEHGVIGPCALSEGIEDGLTIAAGSPELRVWAAVSLGNIGQAPALPCVDAWLVHRQNDWATRQAVASFDKVKEQLQGTERPVAEIRVPGVFKDINDLARG